MMAIEKYDIAIIGGGLAGLSLAIQSANAGYKTVLFEKESYPFQKVCGEYISNESAPFIKSLGVIVDNWELPQINQLKISSPNGREYSFPLGLGGFGVSRYKLDFCLYELAQKAGVVFYTNTKVQQVIFTGTGFTIETDQSVFYAEIAAGSFGKRSNLDIKYNRSFASAKPSAYNNYIGVKYHIQFPHPENEIALHNFKDGYCGMSQIEDGKSCLCYLTTAKNLRDGGNSIQKMEESILYRNPALKYIFKNAHFLFEKPITISQISFQSKSQVEDHLLCVGDAAGMITPLCGNGMSMALHASKIAFEQINYYFRNGRDRNSLERNYSEAWKRAFEKRVWMGRTVQHFFGNEFATNGFLKIMHSMPFVAKQLILSTHGKTF